MAAFFNKSGPARVQAELTALDRAIRRGSLPNFRNLRLEGDNLMVWRIEAVAPFDKDLPGGAALNHDLAALAQRFGPQHDCILFELRFPDSYPSQPFLLRVVTPRCRMYTGEGRGRFWGPCPLSKALAVQSFGGQQGVGGQATGCNKEIPINSYAAGLQGTSPPAGLCAWRPCRSPAAQAPGSLPSRPRASWRLF